LDWRFTGAEAVSDGGEVDGNRLAADTAIYPSCIGCHHRHPSRPLAEQHRIFDGGTKTCPLDDENRTSNALLLPKYIWALLSRLRWLIGMERGSYCFCGPAVEMWNEMISEKVIKFREIFEIFKTSFVEFLLEFFTIGKCLQMTI